MNRCQTQSAYSPSCSLEIHEKNYIATNFIYKLDSTNKERWPKLFTQTNALASWVPNSSPCSSRWTGVMCYDGIITGLHLTNMGFFGKSISMP
ncbi:hypothetical protein F8388_025999 [Cannabis sativa]|uniref:Leucine-rich repeat-containing N-terminal plant-type domain-containing protein n=1 Tax=Cannabis sativa TaxID=3483 RepID=A0A7J6ECB0_CANSA|nr:hypothetical protein F8388_025999 [Cannabis sativa]